MTPDFHCEVEKLEQKDASGNRVTKVICHGRLVSQATDLFKATVKPLIAEGGKIVIDLGDVSHLDSSGLGALVGLKASAIHQGYCILELENMTPRVLDLLRITNLLQLFGLK
jgi:anti-anti-sigma factor